MRTLQEKYLEMTPEQLKKYDDDKKTKKLKKKLRKKLKPEDKQTPFAIGP